MVAGLHKAYRCKECGVVFLKSYNGKLLVISNEQENSSRPRSGNKPSRPLVILKKLLGFLCCPQCGSLQVFEDIGIRA